MKLQLFSDLHLEFDAFEARIDNTDVAVFAGDIHVGIKGIEWLQRFKMDTPIIYVLGNHEYYKQTYPKLINKIKEATTQSNIHILENECVSIDGVTFHGCTLWTDFELFGDPRVAGYECQNVMTDYKKIRKLPGYSKLRAIDVSMIHHRSKNWLSESLKKSSGPNVVVTHHGPSLRSVPAKYKNDIVTSAYVSALDEFIREHSPDLWLHGHLHISSDYHIDHCRVVCNPRGYPGEFNPDFENEKLIEIF